MSTGTMLLYAGYGGFGITLLLLIVFLIFPPKRRSISSLSNYEAGSYSIKHAVSGDQPTEILEEKTDILMGKMDDQTDRTVLLNRDTD